MSARLMDGPAVADLLFGRFAPSLATAQPGRAPSCRPAILSAGRDPEDVQASERAAHRLREAIAQADIDCSDRRWLEVDGGLEQTIHLSGAPDATFFGWLLHAMQSPKPWTLSVHVRPLDRSGARASALPPAPPPPLRRQPLRRGLRTVPDYDQRDHETEIAEIVAELSHSATGNLYDLAVLGETRGMTCGARQTGVGACGQPARGRMPLWTAHPRKRVRWSSSSSTTTFAASCSARHDCGG